jgi:hypothetical protein
LNWRKKGPGPIAEPVEPVFDPEELLGIVPADLKIPVRSSRGDRAHRRRQRFR